MYLYAADNPTTYGDPTGHDFSIAETMIDAGIDQAIGAITSAAIRPAANYLLSTLIPPTVQSGIMSSVGFDAITYGIGASFGGPFSYNSAFGVTGGGGFEYLKSPRTHQGAFYGYLGGGLLIGAAGDGGGVAASIGLVFDTPKSQNYIQHFVTVSIPFGVLLQPLQQRIEQRLVGAMADMSGIPFSAAQAAGWGLGKYVDYQLYAESNAVQKAKNLINNLPSLGNLAVNFFFDPTFGGSWGFSIGYNISKLSFGDSGSPGSITYSYYWQLYPRNNQNVPFE